MGQSIRASEQGLAIIDQVRQRRGWTKTSTARWWQEAHTSRATLRRFWRRERIQHAAFVAICQTVGVNDWEAIADFASPNPEFQKAEGRRQKAEGETEKSDPKSKIQNPKSKIPDSQRIDWGDAPDIEQFYDRASELTQLEQWIVRDRIKLIHIGGLGGIGKTTLAVALVEQLQSEFEGIIWRSVDGLASFEIVLSNLLDSPATPLNQVIEQLLHKLFQQRLLLILESLNPPAELLSALCQFTTARHQSCVIVILRDPLPAELLSRKRMKSLVVSGLSVAASVQLLQACGCRGTTDQLQALARLYSYNPLALELISATIQTVFDGWVAPFLAQNTIVIPDAIQLILGNQFETLSPLEQSLLVWLAIWQEPIALCRLQTHLLTANPGDVIQALSRLVGRSLITRHFLTDEPSFSLQPMVMTFVVDTFVDAMVAEIGQAQQQQSIEPFHLLRSHCLIRPGTDDILGDRILRQLHTTYGQAPQNLTTMVNDWLAIAQKQSPHEAGYLTVNLQALKAIWLIP